MKAFILPALLVVHFSFAQNIIGRGTIRKFEEPVKLSGRKSAIIPVDFDRAELKTEISYELKECTIEQIDLLYTTYKENPEFDQNELNQKRIQNLLNILPDAQNELINWRIIGQDGATDNKSAHEYFHGFVIYYRPIPTDESMKKEMDYIDSLLGFKTFESEMSNERSSNALPVKADVILFEPLQSHAESISSESAIPDYGTDMFFSSIVEEFDNKCYTRFFDTIITTPKKFNLLVDSILRMARVRQITHTYVPIKRSDNNEYFYNYVRINKECDTSKSLVIGDISFPYFSPVALATSNYTLLMDHDVVGATFKRHPNWKNSLVVMDVTGSMSPYIAQTFAWVKETQKNSQVAAFVYFNDGDMKMGRKITGQVGGIYGSQNTSFDAVYYKMKYTMSKGGGGDCPENNVEASIKAINEYPDCDELVMIADNYATPRDLILVKDLNKPVHIILCGAQYGVNIAYLQLAYETGGSVHTIEEDIEMREIQPGVQFKMGNNYFTIYQGQIVKAEHK